MEIRGAAGQLVKQCAVKGAGLQRVNSRPGTGSLHPVAIEAAAEVTKLSELSGVKGRLATPRACRP